MKKFFAVILMSFITSFAFAGIFNEKDSIDAAIAVESQKFPSVVVDVNYKFEPDKNLFVQVGNQSRIMDGWDDYNTTYVGLLLDFDNMDFNKEYEPPLGGGPGNSEISTIVEEKENKHKFFLITRIGVSANMEKSDCGLYAGVGLQYGEEKFVRVMFEAEDGKFRNSIGVGMRFHDLKF